MWAESAFVFPGLPVGIISFKQMAHYQKISFDLTKWSVTSCGMEGTFILPLSGSTRDLISLIWLCFPGVLSHKAELSVHLMYNLWQSYTILVIKLSVRANLDCLNGFLKMFLPIDATCEICEVLAKKLENWIDIISGKTNSKEKKKRKKNSMVYMSDIYLII